MNIIGFFRSLFFPRYLTITVWYPDQRIKYPKDLPLPRIGDYLVLEGRLSEVERVYHSTLDNVTRIDIIVIPSSNNKPEPTLL